jgi:hypothetical protein
MQEKEWTFIRSLAAIVLGYIFKGIVVGIYFVAAGWKPDGELPEKIVLMGMVWRALASVAAGYLAGAIAGRKEVEHAFGVAVLTAAGAIVSMLSGQGGQEPLWAQITNLCIMFPMVLLGGYLRNRQMYLKGDPEM